jgi:hypothetical protein
MKRVVSLIALGVALSLGSITVAVVAAQPALASKHKPKPKPKKVIHKVDFHLSGAVNTNLVLSPYDGGVCDYAYNQTELLCTFRATDPAKIKGYLVDFVIRSYSGSGTFDAAGIVSIEEVTAAEAVHGGPTRTTRGVPAPTVTVATAGQVVVQRSSSLSGLQVGTATGRIDADVPLSEGAVQLSGTWNVRLVNPSGSPALR